MMKAIIAIAYLPDGSECFRVAATGKREAKGISLQLATYYAMQQQWPEIPINITWTPMTGGGLIGHFRDMEITLKRGTNPAHLQRILAEIEKQPKK